MIFSRISTNHHWTCVACTLATQVSTSCASFPGHDVIQERAFPAVAQSNASRRDRCAQGWRGGAFDCQSAIQASLRITPPFTCQCQAQDRPRSDGGEAYSCFFALLQSWSLFTKELFSWLAHFPYWWVTMEFLKLWLGGHHSV